MLQLLLESGCSLPPSSQSGGASSSQGGGASSSYSQGNGGGGGKENRAGAPTRAGSVPARATTPETHAQNRRAAMGSRPASAGATKRPASAASDNPGSKRQRLGDAGVNRGQGVDRVPPVPPLPGTGTAGTGTTKLAMPMPVKASNSTIPRPTAIRAGQHATLGHGRAPPHPNVRAGVRQVSAPAGRSLVANAGKTGIGLAGKTGSGAPDPKKASRARRESFKPRPSVDAGWAPSAPVPKYGPGGLGDGVREEDED